MLTAAVTTARAAPEKLVCRDTPLFRVMSRAMSNKVGDLIIVRKRVGAAAPGACSMVRKPNDDTIAKPGNATYVLKAIGKDLFLDKGKGSLRHFAVHDMANKKQILSVETVGTPVFRPSGPTLWITDGPASQSNCPDWAKFAASGGGAAIERDVAFDINAGILRDLGHRRCAYRE